MQKHDRYWWLAVVIIACAIVLVTFGYKYVGVTWDENLQGTYGEAVLRFLSSGFTNRGFEHISNLYLYGPVFDALVAFFNQFVKMGMYEFRHLVQGLVGVITLVGTWRLTLTAAAARPRSHRTRAALLAVAVLATWPVFVGHSFFNPKDIPFAAAYVWSLFALLRIRAELPRVRIGTILLGGLTIGLAMAVRVGGVVLLGLLGLILLEYAAHLFVQRDWKKFIAHLQIGRLAHVLVAIFILSYAIMLLLWPWAAKDPLHHPRQALSELSHINQQESLTYFAGQLMHSNRLPWYYVPTIIGIQAPEIVLIALVGGALWLIIRIARGIRRRHVVYAYGRNTVLWLVIFSVVPWLIALITKPSLYDQARHFIFLIPPLATLSALSLDAVWHWVLHKRSWMRWTVGIGAGLYAAAQISLIIYLHPYSYIYGNILVGGVSGMAKNFEADYWGSSVNESVRLLNQYLVEHSGNNPVPKTLVYACGDVFGGSYRAPSYMRFTLDPSAAEYGIGFKRNICAVKPQDALLVVRRFGVPIGWVQKLK